MQQPVDLTIVIPTIPERRELVQEAIASVQAQTQPCAYKVGEDRNHNGPAPTLNALANTVETDWLFRLDDDDLLDPDHVEVLSHWLDDADIVYTWCRVEGQEREDLYQYRIQDEYGWGHLHKMNWIPCSAAIRAELWRDLGGLREVDEEDWDFWKRAYDAGATFKCVPAVTWTYRMNAEWTHRSVELLRRMHDEPAEGDRVHGIVDSPELAERTRRF